MYYNNLRNMSWVKPCINSWHLWAGKAFALIYISLFQKYALRNLAQYQSKPWGSDVCISGGFTSTLTFLINSQRLEDHNTFASRSFCTTHSQRYDHMWIHAWGKEQTLSSSSLIPLQAPRMHTRGEISQHDKKTHMEKKFNFLFSVNGRCKLWNIMYT